MGADERLAAGRGAGRSEQPLKSAADFRQLDQGPVELSNLVTYQLEMAASRDR